MCNLFLDINECPDGANTSTCHVDASCFDNEGSYDCTCNDGYIGDGFHACNSK